MPNQIGATKPINGRRRKMISLMERFPGLLVPRAAVTVFHHSRSQLKAYNLKCRCAGSGASSAFGTRSRASAVMLTG